MAAKIKIASMAAAARTDRAFLAQGTRKKAADSQICLRVRGTHILLIVVK